jgi:hypothetical protein
MTRAVIVKVSQPRWLNWYGDDSRVRTGGWKIGGWNV